MYKLKSCVFLGSAVIHRRTLRSLKISGVRPNLYPPELNPVSAPIYIYEYILISDQNFYSESWEVTCFYLIGPHMLDSIPQRHFVTKSVERFFARSALGTPLRHEPRTQLMELAGLRINPIHSPASQLATSRPQSTTSLQPKSKYS